MGDRSAAALKEIVPEYHSPIPMVRWLFMKRLAVAISLADLDEAPTLHLLDLGCGEGLLSETVRRRFPRHRCVAWDHHPAVKALMIPDVVVEMVDITRDEEVPRQTFDRIFCLDVLEHIAPLDPIVAILRRLLRPRGRLIVSEPTESLLYRLGRLAIKGTFSQESGPGAGPHYHNARGVHAHLIRGGFERLCLRRVPLPWPGDLFHISVYTLPT